MKDFPSPRTGSSGINAEYGRMKREREQTTEAKGQAPLRRFRHQPSVEKQVRSPPNTVSSTLYVVDSSHKIIQVGMCESFTQNHNAKAECGIIFARLMVVIYPCSSY
eukprot:TRINITY_DN635_c0_g3_i2.p2 TRINITY_DN635_c0_g3~~TRINITY_DN635_c0_g3_i2.p2  ORF type:complete len:107 (-),score=15.17 TRINITY_DN635_c0_g3_i2:1170-1490(-)